MEREISLPLSHNLVEPSDDDSSLKATGTATGGPGRISVSRIAPSRICRSVLELAFSARTRAGKK